jgi:hypothetical protein
MCFFSSSVSGESGEFLIIANPSKIKATLLYHCCFLEMKPSQLQFRKNLTTLSLPFSSKDLAPLQFVMWSKFICTFSTRLHLPPLWFRCVGGC